MRRHRDDLLVKQRGEVETCCFAASELPMDAAQRGGESRGPCFCLLLLSNVLKHAVGDSLLVLSLVFV